MAPHDRIRLIGPLRHAKQPPTALWRGVAALYGLLVLAAALIPAHSGTLSFGAAVDKPLHAGAFFVATLLASALPIVRARLGRAVLALILLSGMLEALQLAVPSRTASLLDWGAGAVGTAAAAAVLLVGRRSLAHRRTGSILEPPTVQGEEGERCRSGACRSSDRASSS